MECELCGKSIVSAIPVKIEGSTVEVCGSCAQYGERVTKKKKSFQPPSWQPQSRRRPSNLRKDDELELFEDYPQIIKSAREKRGMNQEQLGKLLKERASVINRIEGGKMKPDSKLINKLENTLGIKIKGKIETEKIVSTGSTNRELTLGDMVKIKKI